MNRPATYYFTLAPISGTTSDRPATLCAGSDTDKAEIEMATTRADLDPGSVQHAKTEAGTWTVQRIHQVEDPDGLICCPECQPPGSTPTAEATASCDRCQGEGAFARAHATAHELEVEANYMATVTADEESECEGHPCEDAADQHPHAGIGEIFYCDGTCRA